MRRRKEIKIREILFIEFIVFISLLIIDISLEFSPLQKIWSKYSYDIISLSSDIIILSILIILIRPSKLYIKYLITDFKKKLNIKELFGRYINGSIINMGTNSLVIGVFILVNVQLANEILNTSSSKDMLYDGSMITNIISIVIMAPILEELIFRKILFKRLAKKTNATIGIILSSVIFGLLHATDSMLSAMLFGVILCILYIKYDNILIPMSLHFSNNLIATLLLLSQRQQDSEVTMLTQQDSYMFIGIGIVITIIGLYFYIRYIIKNKSYIKKHSIYLLKYKNKKA